MTDSALRPWVSDEIRTTADSARFSLQYEMVVMIDCLQKKVVFTQLVTEDYTVPKGPKNLKFSS